METYLVALATFGCIYALLTLGLNITWGMAGLINLGLAGFYALGAYVSALLTTRLGTPIAVGIGAAMLASAAGGILVAFSTVRLRDDYLAVVTLGFAEVVRLVAANAIGLTGGTDGISGIPGPLRARVDSAFNITFLGIAVAAVAAALVLAELIRRSPYGRALRAIRDDDQAAAVAGKPVVRFKIEAFALGAAFCGLAGALYGHYTSYIAPDNFVPLVAIYVFLALTLGGTGNNIGALVGAFTLIALLESTRFLTGVIPFLSGVQLAASREILIGVLLLVVLRFRPHGLIPEHPAVVAVPKYDTIRLNDVKSA